MDREPTLSTSFTLTSGSNSAGSGHLFIDDSFCLGVNSASTTTTSSTENNNSNNSSSNNLNSINDIMMMGLNSEKFIPPNNSKLLPSNIHNLDWSRAIHIERCQYKNQKNTFSLFYVTFSKIIEEKEHYYKVMLKTSNNITQEVYSSILATICRVPLPTMRLIEYSTSEFASMSKSLTRLSSDLVFIKKELKKKFFLVMECVEGKPLGELNIKDFFNEKKYVQLGQIMAFDLFCNNFDRFNNFWEKGENEFLNIIANDAPSKDGWYFTILDTRINFIVNSSFTVGYHKHINRLKSLLYSIFSNPYSECTQIKKMRETVNKQCKINLNENAGLYIQHGMMVGIQSIVTYLTPEILKDTRDRVKSLISCDSDNIWKRGVDSIYLPFIMDVLEKFDEFEVTIYQPFLKHKKEIKKNSILVS